MKKVECQCRPLQGSPAKGPGESPESFREVPGKVQGISRAGPGNLEGFL